MSRSWFKIFNRSLLDRLPPYVDPARWASFREKLVRAEKLEDNGHPVQINIELNGGCNMTCPFCLHGHETIPNVNMDRSTTLDEILTQAKALGVQSLKLSNTNEPLLRKDFENIVIECRSRGFDNIYMHTNGTALTPERRRRLIESGITKIFVSIDATTAETYNAQRLSGQFDRVVANVRALIEERSAMNREFPIILVSFLVNKLNAHEAEDFEREWVGVADIVSFQTMNEIPDYHTGLAFSREAPAQGCSFPFKMMMVEHNGEIRPCCKFPGRKLALGNIKDTTLAQAWERGQWIRDMHANGDWKNHEVCGMCLRCE